ncbi:hypothetical protein [Streptomyces halstedii]|uniref:hypothetical protein n=1 Tax=Streptomyces halstedii TaxID=1944 RepID=UPI003694F3B2
MTTDDRARTGSLTGSVAQRSGAELGALIEEATVDTYNEVGAVNGFLAIVDELLRQVLGHLHGAWCVHPVSVPAPVVSAHPEFTRGSRHR